MPNPTAFRSLLKERAKIVCCIFFVCAACLANTWAADKPGTYQVQKGVQYWEATGKYVKTPPGKNIKPKTFSKGEKVTVQKEAKEKSLVQVKGKKETFWVNTEDVVPIKVSAKPTTEKPTGSSSSGTTTQTVSNTDKGMAETSPSTNRMRNLWEPSLS